MATNKTATHVMVYRTSMESAFDWRDVPASLKKWYLTYIAGPFNGCIS